MRRCFAFFSAVVLASGLISLQSALAQNPKPVPSSAPSPQAHPRPALPRPAELSPAQPTLHSIPNDTASRTASPNFGGFPAGHLFSDGISQPALIVAGDFNNDGKPDFASISTTEIDVWLNDGTGSFGAPVVTPMVLNTQTYFIESVGAKAVAVDLNGDGAADLVFSVNASAKTETTPINRNSLIVLPGLKNGSFGPPVLLSPSLPPNVPFVQGSSFSVGKTTASGHADIVVAQSPSKTVWLQTFINDGTGVFKPRAMQSFPIPTDQTVSGFGVRPPVFVDIDHDGKPDLLLALNTNTSNSMFTEYVYAALGNGDGTFTLAAANPIATFPSNTWSSEDSRCLLAQSLTSDSSKLDLVFSNSLAAYVALSNGDGTYQTPGKILDFDAISQLQLADLNADGKTDLIVIGNGQLVTYLGNGDGTFGSVAGTAVANDGPSSPESHTAIADFNGDGKLDFINGDSGLAELVLGNGDGTFAGTPTLYSLTAQVPPDYPLTEAVGDLNGDGLTDLVALVPNSILSALADGKGGFTYHHTALAPANYSPRFIEPTLADFNGDGKRDVIFAGNNHDAAIGLSNGDGTLKTPVTVLTPAPALQCDLGYSAAGDVNGDGKQDIVFVYSGGKYCAAGSPDPSGYFVVLGNGDGTFQAPVFYPYGNELFSIALGHFHGKDQPIDLILGDYGLDGSNSPVSILQGRGNGTFGTAVQVYSGVEVTQILTDDFNQDGNPDLTLSGDFLPDQTGVLLYPGIGDGTFGTPKYVRSESSVVSAAYADMNGDGIPDLITGGAILAVNLGTGSGDFAPPIQYFSAYDNLFVGNFLGDKTQSVIASGAFLGGTAFYMNQGGTALVATATPGSVSSGQTVTLAATLTPTIATRPAPTGTITFYDGSTSLGTGPIGTPLSASKLAVGTHNIIASYSGDANFNPNTSAPVTVIVVASAPDVSVMASAATMTVVKGQSGTLTLSLDANQSFNGSVSFQCTGLPSEATCAFAPPTLSLAAGATGKTTLTISTRASTTSNVAGALTHYPLNALGGLACAGLICLVAPRKRGLWMAMFAVVALGTLAGLAGCGGSGSHSTPITDPGTPSGTTTVTVTLTATSGTTTINRTAAIALTVQ